MIWIFIILTQIIFLAYFATFFNYFSIVNARTSTSTMNSFFLISNQDSFLPLGSASCHINLNVSQKLQFDLSNFKSLNSSHFGLPQTTKISPSVFKMLLISTFCPNHYGYFTCLIEKYQL
jgi:hypothetical protein